MDIRRIAAGSALAAGIGVAGMVGAGVASALPGISYDNGSGEVGLGDHGPNTKTGAYAQAANGTQALAISVFGPARASTVGAFSGSTALAIDGEAVAQSGIDGRATAVGGKAYASGNYSTATAFGGDAFSGANSSVLSIGSVVDTNGKANQTVAAVCGQSVLPTDPGVTVKGSPGPLTGISCLP